MIDTTVLGLPAGIHATVIAERHAGTGQLIERGIVWADRTYRTCGTCGEPVPYAVTDCPVTLGQVGDIRQWSQAHCDIGGACGVWQTVLWATCGATEHEIEAAARDLHAARAGALGVARTEMSARLTASLGEALHRLAAGGDESDVITGSETEPGVYREAGELLAWDYDPGDESETVTVYASDLAA